MANIYACAQLTIVAALGEDADYGLLDSYKKSALPSFSTTLRSLQLLPCPKEGESHRVIETSRWASRAWTFQECYFSRRRLFFIGDQVVYICNDKENKFMRNGWSPYQPRLNLRSRGKSRNAFLHSMIIMRAYSSREMTYESDALSAIVSSLTSLEDGKMQQIWGLPLLYPQLSGVASAPYSEGELGLFWLHEQPCSRRFGFPSWSSIAWTKEIHWYFFRATNTWRIALLAHPESTTNESFGLAYTSDNFENAPRYLRITADMASLRLVLTPVLKEDGAVSSLDDQKLFLAFPLDSNLDIILHEPHWDLDPRTIDPTKPIIGILSSSEKPHSPYNGPIVLLVQLRESFYERVGILQLESKINYQPRLFLHAGRYVMFFHRDTAQISQHEVHGVENMDCIDSKDIKSPFWEHSEWRRFFVQDSIILG
jgi:hypothetical protein